MFISINTVCLVERTIELYGSIWLTFSCGACDNVKDAIYTPLNIGVCSDELQVALIWPTRWIYNSGCKSKLFRRHNWIESWGNGRTATPLGGKIYQQSMSHKLSYSKNALTIVRDSWINSKQLLSIKRIVPSCPPPSWPTSLHVWGSRPQRGAPGGGSTPPASAGSWWHRSRGSLSFLQPTWPVPLGCGPMGSARIWGYPPFCRSVGCWWRLCRRTHATAAGRRAREVASYSSSPEQCR